MRQSKETDKPLVLQMPKIALHKLEPSTKELVVQFDKPLLTSLNLKYKYSFFNQRSKQKLESTLFP